jgi:riboflavin biosynthesis pyrimidine reductase
VLAPDGARCIIISAGALRADLPANVETIALPCCDGRLDPVAILAALAARGLRRILVEGGAGTISHFFAAGCLDRLHIVVAPLILGTGAASITLPPIERVDEGVRPPTRAHMLGSEVLFDCALTAQRRVIGCAKKST